MNPNELSSYEREKLLFRGRGLSDFQRKVSDPLPVISSTNSDVISVLELGCGFGQLLIDLFLSSKVPLDLYGVSKSKNDIDLERAVKVAKFKNLDFEIEANTLDIKFIHQNMDYGLPFPSQSFDIILSQVCIAYIHDKLFLLEEVARVLKPFGTALLHVEFEYGRTTDNKVDDGYTTLVVNDGSGPVDLDAFFSRFNGLSYERKRTGSILKINGGTTIDFSANLIRTSDVDQPGQHGVKSIYETR